VTAVRDAALEVLREAEGPLHWTVIQDRALRAGLIDPFATPDVRGAVHAALRELVAEGAAVRTERGVYAEAEGPAGQGR
jgi:HB1, ASXL, restriction endonuclease HTH domain